MREALERDVWCFEFLYVFDYIFLIYLAHCFLEDFLAKPVTSKALAYVAAMSSFGEAAKACIKVI